MADGGRSLEDIGRRLTVLRGSLNMNQGAFAAHVGLTQPALSNYEGGTRRPEVDAATMIAMKTGVTLDWIYLGERSGLPGRLLAILPDLSLPNSRSA